MDFKDLRVELEKYLSKEDVEFVHRAFLKAQELHKGAKRASGEPYITHPLAVALTLANLRLDKGTLAAALLHDTVEDTPYSLDDVKHDFSVEVALLVDGVTKMTELKVASVEEEDAESVRKLLLASVKDLRVVLIKLADKLHNMRTLTALSSERQVRIAREALNVYAPLAYRLGLAQLKWELEDLSFKILEPEIYQKFKLRFGKTRKDRENDIQEIKSLLQAKLLAHGINAEIVGRPKHFYSIYKKMITKNRSFEEVNDLIGLRVITDSVKDCYEVLGILHSLWPPIQGKFKDYIATPKQNLYQSLHTAVVALKQPIEFQVRTRDMHMIAEEGIAAHWSYKHLDGNKSFDKKLSWLRDILDFQQRSQNTDEFMDFLKIDLFDDEVYVMTPKGDVISLPKGSSAIDFAYRIHSSIGDHATGAIVNGRMVPLRYELKTGEIAKILTSKSASPHRDWLKVVKSTGAKSKIRQYLREHGKLPPASLKQVPSSGFGSDLIVVDGVAHARTKLSKCCHPVPLQVIVAYPSSNHQYAVHLKDCSHLSTKSRKSLLKASWNKKFDSKITVRALVDDRLGIFADILGIVASLNINIDPAAAKTVGDGLVECDIGVIPESLDVVEVLIANIKNKVRGVRSVILVEPSQVSH